MKAMWHSARDDPPPEKHRVFVRFDDGQITVGVVRCGYWLTDWNRQNEITHWMELPDTTPDLLAACEMALEALQEYGMVCNTITNTMAYEALVAVIAKAKGPA